MFDGGTSVCLLLSTLTRNRGIQSDNDDSAEAQRIANLKLEIARLKEQDALLTRHSEQAQAILKSMSEDRHCKEYNSFLLFLLIGRMAYLTQKDIRGIPCFKEDTLLAIKAPFGSTLEVPDPDEVFSFSLPHLIHVGDAIGKEATQVRNSPLQQVWCH